MSDESCVHCDKDITNDARQGIPKRTNYLLGCHSLISESRLQAVEKRIIIIILMR